MKRKSDTVKFKLPVVSGNPRKVFVLLLFLLAQLVFITSDSFRLKNVEITGMEHLKGEDVVASCSLPWGKFLWQIDSKSLHDRLAAISWIKSFKIKKKFPGTLKIELSERNPVVAISAADKLHQWFGVDIDGRVLLPLTAKEAESYPKLIVDDKIVVDSLTDKEKIRSIMSFSDLLPLNVRKNVLFYAIDIGGYLSFRYNVGKKDFEIRFGSIEELLRNPQDTSINDKTAILAEMMKQMKDKLSLVEYIDLRYSEPVVKFIVPPSPKKDKDTEENLQAAVPDGV